MKRLTKEEEAKLKLVKTFKMAFIGIVIGTTLALLSPYSASTKIERAGGSLFDGTSKWQLNHSGPSTKYGG